MLGIQLPRYDFARRRQGGPEATASKTGLNYCYFIVLVTFVIVNAELEIGGNGDEYIENRDGILILLKFFQQHFKGKPVPILETNDQSEYFAVQAQKQRNAGRPDECIN